MREEKISLLIPKGNINWLMQTLQAEAKYMEDGSAITFPIIQVPDSPDGRQMYVIDVELLYQG